MKNLDANFTLMRFTKCSSFMIRTGYIGALRSFFHFMHAAISHAHFCSLPRNFEYPHQFLYICFNFHIAKLAEHLNQTIWCLLVHAWWITHTWSHCFNGRLLTCIGTKWIDCENWHWGVCRLHHCTVGRTGDDRSPLKQSVSDLFL